MKISINLRNGMKYIFFDFILLILILICCQNTYNPDYRNYENIYIAVGTQNTKNFIYSVEPLYTMTCFIFYKLHFNFYQFRFLFCFVEFILLRKVILDYSLKPVLTLLCFSMYPFLIFCVQMRNAMGIVIVMYGIRFLQENTKRSNLKYIVTVVIATLFHSSCIIYLSLFLVKSKNFYKKYKYIVMVEIIITYTILPYIMRIIYALWGNRRYLVYNVGTPMSVVLRHTLPVVTLVIVFYYCLGYEKNKNREMLNINELLIRCSLIDCSYMILIKININFFRTVYFMFPLMIMAISNYSVNGDKRLIKSDRYLLTGYSIIFSAFYFVMFLSPLQEETYNNVTLSFLPFLK